MQYMGSKRIISRHILPIMLENRQRGQWWVEPFVGGANMIDKVTGPRIGNDSHQFLIALLAAVRDGYIPPEIVDRELYYDIKSNQNKYPPELVGFVGFLCSFGGKWWGGFAANAAKRNYARSGSRALSKQAKSLSDVVFRHGDYAHMAIPDNSIIYCDPPYQGTTGYKDKFDHAAFWEWCRQKARDGHDVFVSEYSAPKDFICIKEVEFETRINKNKPQARTERLFKYNL